MTPEFLLSNLDRIGAYALLIGAVWALLTGRLIPIGQLNDQKEYNALLRQKNDELTEAVKAGNAAQSAIVRQMEDVNRTLERLAEEPPPRPRGRAT